MYAVIANVIKDNQLRRVRSCTFYIVTVWLKVHWCMVWPGEEGESRSIFPTKN